MNAADVMAAPTTPEGHARALALMMAAREDLLTTAPFYGSLALRLEMMTEDCGTAWTDGDRVAFDPGFVISLTHPKRVGLLAHEISHPAYGHNWRRGGRCAEGWNAACDYAINGELKRAGFDLPDGGLFPSPEWDGRSAEWIFDRLPEGEGRGPSRRPEGEDEGEGEGEGKGKGKAPDNESTGEGRTKPGEVRDASEEARTESEIGSGDGKGPERMTRDDWAGAVADATMVAKLRREFGDGAARVAKASIAHPVDWSQELREVMEATRAGRTSWARPDKRYRACGLYLPGRIDEPAMRRLTIAIDCSGSMIKEQLDRISASCAALFDEVGPESVTVVYFDSTIQGEETFEDGAGFALTLRGGGGTDFRPVFDHIETSEDDDPDALIIFTDLMGPMPSSPPDFPVIWVDDLGYGSVPFGELVDASGGAREGRS